MKTIRTRLLLLLFKLILVLSCVQNAPAQSIDSKTMEDVLRMVAADVEKNYYDVNLKGLDWRALTDESREKIRKSQNLGEMIGIVTAQFDKLNDSHTGFLPPMLSQKADFGFKGMAFGKDLLIYSVEKDGEAEKAGLQVGDKILAVNGYEMDRDSFYKVMWYFSTLSPRIEMYVTVSHNGEPEKTVRVPAALIGQRQFADYNSVFRVADDQRIRDSFRVNFTHKDYEDGVVYLKLPSFAAPSDHLAALAKKAENGRAVIIDLRKNGGGPAESMTTFLSYFTSEAVVGSETYRNKTEPIKLKLRPKPYSVPMLVLVDSSSGSASEITARHLQLHDHAVIVGDRTSGRVNLSQYFGEKIGAGRVMYYGSFITIAKVVMSDGKELEKQGVVPDMECIHPALI